MRHHRRTWTSWARLGVPLTLALGAPAAADEPVQEPPTTKRAAQILDHMDWAPEERTHLLSRFGIDKGQGLSFRRTIRVGGRSIECGIYGPVQRRTSFGLGFKIRF